VFENTEAGEIEPNPLIVHANGYKVRCRYVVIATHNPRLSAVCDRVLRLADGVLAPA